ncbi:MAG: HAD-IIIA family hydrolase [Oligoflexales bacterium]|nr:HAD-IIIA family hydrolase [Oligoflexales bacterium]
MQEPVELVVEAHPDSLFCKSTNYRKLFFDALFKQGFHKCYLLTEVEDLDCKHKLSTVRMSKKAFVQGQFPLADKILFLNAQNFVSFGFNDLLQEKHSFSLGIKIATKNENYPFFDSEACLSTSNFFNAAWVDAYSYAGALVCEKKPFLKALSEAHTDGQLIRLLQSFCHPSSKLLGGFTVDHQVHADLSKLKAYVSQSMKPCLFLDRDGVINVDTGYPHREDQFQPIDDIIPIIEWAKNRSWWVVVVTNQAGLAKGIFNREDYLKFTSLMQNWLTKKQVEVDLWQHCPYHPQGKCEGLSFFSLKRKPYPGMVLEAMASLPIDVKRSLIIGDRESDALRIDGLNALLIEGRYPLDKAQGVPVVKSHKQALQYLEANF